MHRGEDLDLVEGIEAEPLGDPLLDQGDDQLQDPLRVLLLDEVKIVELLRGACQVRHLPLVDQVGVDDDRAFPGLAEDLVELDDGNGPGIDDVPEDVSRPDGGELVHVAHEDKGRPRRNGLEQVVHQEGVDHRGLVDDQEVAVERRILVFLEAALLEAVFEKAVDRLGLVARRLGHPFGGPAGRGGQEDLRPDARKDPEHGVDDRRLPRSGAAGDDQHLVAGDRADRLDLFFGKRDGELLLEPGDRLFRLDLPDGPGGLDQGPESGGKLRLGRMVPGQIHRLVTFPGRPPDPGRDPR